MQPSTIPLPADIRWRRLFVLALFLGLLFYFRHLAPIFVCFVILSRALGWLSDVVEVRLGWTQRRSVASLLTAFAVVVAIAVAAVVREAVPYVRTMRTEWRDYVDELSHHPAVEKLRHYAVSEGEGGGVSDTVKHYALASVKYATAFAHVALFLLIGFILAVIYLFEQEEIDEFFHGLARDSIAGTLARWGGYVADSIVVTVRMQVVTAAVNALFTLPILVFLRLPHAPLLFLLILVTGLLPVVGNLIAGTVLCVVAYEARGLWAVGVFVVLTFVLHKIESYYLTPRLAAQHVKLPGLLLVASLIVFEESFGFVGLFLSFPTLYVAMRIKNEWRAQPVEAVAPDGTATVLEAARPASGEASGE